MAEKRCGMGRIGGLDAICYLVPSRPRKRKEQLRARAGRASTVRECSGPLPWTPEEGKKWNFIWRIGTMCRAR